jgi:hypothetical protein
MDRMKKAAEGAQAATSHVGVGASRGQMDLANRAQLLMKEGVDTPARIDSMTPTGKTDKPGGAENIIELTVSPAGGAPYQVSMNQYIYPQAPFAAGENVIVKVLPSDPNTVMIFDRA